MHHSGVHMSKGTSAFFCVVINKGTCLTEHSVEKPTLRRKTPLKYGDVKCFLFCWKRCLPCADLFAWSCFILFLILPLLKVALLFKVGENYNGLLHICFLILTLIATFLLPAPGTLDSVPLLISE